MKISGSTTVNSVPKSSPTGARSETSVYTQQSPGAEKTLPGNDVRAALEKASDVDMAEVNRIRQAIADGSLSLDSKALARAVMDMHLG